MPSMGQYKGLILRAMTICVEEWEVLIPNHLVVAVRVVLRELIQAMKILRVHFAMQ